MRIIEIGAQTNGAHRNQTMGVEIPVPDGWAVIPDDLVIPATFPFVNVTAENGIVTGLTAGTVPEPAGPSLAQAQALRIAESKIKLAKYLEFHPLMWADGKQYSVTEDKQALLTGNLAAYQLAVALGQENPELTWNATGEECTVWTFENLAMLAIAIKAYVKPLVAYQQTAEVAIMACTTTEDVGAVPLDYGSVSNA